MRTGVQLIGKFLILTLLLFVLFQGLLIAAYSIPNERLSWSVDQSKSRLEGEGLYPQYFFENVSAVLDGSTDLNVIVRRAIRDENASAFINAQVPPYPRYWHGYQIVLRPLLVFFNLSKIRQMNALLQFSLLCVLLLKLRQRTSIAVAVGFMVSLTMACFFIVPVSLQYSGDFLLMYLFSILLLFTYGKPRFDRHVIFWFFLFGALDSYFTLLVAPVMVLGIPALFILLMDLYAGKTEVKTNFITACKHCASWVSGYVVLWASKWASASLILKKDIVQNAAEALSNRVSGEGTHEVPVLDRGLMLRNNLDTMFHPFGYLLLAITLLVLLILLIQKRPFKALKQALPLLLISSLPYVWFLMASNHSQLHYFFTYRNQIVSSFGIFSLGVYVWQSVQKPTIKTDYIK